MKRQFDIAIPNTVWVGDITYIWCNNQWIYLAVVMDLSSRKVIGHAISNIANTQLIVQALHNAWHNTGKPTNVMFHSDQGVQYKSQAFRLKLEQYGFIQSMSRKGNCHDNAVVERLFRSLKTEWVPVRGYDNIYQAKK